MRLLILCLFSCTLFIGCTNESDESESNNDALVAFQELAQMSEVAIDCNKALTYIEEVRGYIYEINYLASKWVLIQSRSDNPEKERLQQVVDKDLPDALKILKELPIVKRSHSVAFVQIEEETALLVEIVNEIMKSLNSLISYDDPINMLTTQSLIENDGELVSGTTKVVRNLAQLTAMIKSDAENYEYAIDELIKEVLPNS